MGFALSNYLPPLETKVSSCSARSDLLGSERTAFLRVYRVEDLLNDLIQAHDDLRRLDAEFLAWVKTRAPDFDSTVGDIGESILNLYRRWQDTAQRVAECGMIDHPSDSNERPRPGVVHEFEKRLEAIQNSETLGYRPELHRENERLSAEIWDFINSNS